MAYAIVHSSHAEMFNQYQQTLDKTSGAINTILLITASYFVVIALQKLKEESHKIASYWLWAAFIVGFGFVINKSLEFYEHSSHGIRLSTNLFYMFYLSMTFFHFMHVILGMIILAWMAKKSAEGVYTPDNLNGAVSGGAYWHMVDLVWIVLFPLIYVMK